VNYVRRDIKPENLLMHQGSVKLMDFGLSIRQDEERPVTRLGTLSYMGERFISLYI
jgi:aurora kinase, other